MGAPAASDRRRKTSPRRASAPGAVFPVARSSWPRQSCQSVRGTELFDEVVRLTGVSSVLAPGMVTRSLADGGVTVDAARPQDYEAALPRLRARLKAYLPPPDAEARTQAIAARLAELRTAPRPTPAATPRHLPDHEKSGEKDVSRAGDKSSKTDLGRLDLTPSYELDAGDTTLHGRRWTADEQAQIEQARRNRDRK